MNFDELFHKIRSGELSRDEARRLVSLSFLEAAESQTLDFARELRTGIPEIIFAERKPFEKVAQLVDRLLEQHSPAIVSRFPDPARLAAHYSRVAEFHQEELLCVIGTLPEPSASVLVISAGSSDHTVVAETALCLRALGVNPLVYEDRGIAHPTRVIEALRAGIEQEIKAAIVVAGMEASLASYVSSLLPVPVIGVPTSVGYGYHAGESALISMLASCTPNLVVVNTDGGVRAAVFASLIAQNGRTADHAKPTER